ncbi:Fe-S cluster assembly protein SufD [Dichotomicrobium thermohalophilum]|uniref:Fe-S cluster assembly protein SufD n=1 Tax=Dichotomicrobium thermohalophilum TaxID=933063 RepID=A0A397QB21_9HYPH|nr:Fe-S cluster assembly protein SufD [Dichotomicrobium thermohalophilum]RIA56687.1 Fe-S cluster assembly protein SufD [Dichotomicrobium thermohalophilum]
MNIETPVRVTEDHSPAEADLLRSFEQRIAQESDARVRQLREQAIGAFARSGLPHRRVEEWKYTDLRARMREAFAPAPRTDGISEAELVRARGHFDALDAHVVVFVNGYHQPMQAIDAPNVQVMTLSEALESRPDWFDEMFGQVNPKDPETVANLATAFMTDGAVIRITAPANGAAAKPIHLVNVTTGDQPGRIATRNLIRVEKGAEATIVEHYASLNDTAFHTFTMTELLANEGAQIEHLKVQDENKASTHLASWNLRLEAGANYRATHVNVGGELTRNQVFLRYAGEGASAAVNGVCLGRDAQHFDTTMVIEHAVPECMSRELVKSVLDDKARSVFQAKVHVHPGAQKTDGKQMANALLLSDEAEFDSKPELEIYADDVVCGHGSTSGHLDEEAMFYLLARGIPQAEARALLIAAFVDEVFDGIENEALKEALTARTADWLRGSVDASA